MSHCQSICITTGLWVCAHAFRETRIKTTKAVESTLATATYEYCTAVLRTDRRAADATYVNVSAARGRPTNRPRGRIENVGRLMEDGALARPNEPELETELAKIGRH